MVIYLDLVFMLNMLFDSSALLLTAWTRKVKVRIWRVAAGAFIGSAYVLMIFVPPLHFLLNFLIKCVFSALILLTAFGFRSLQHFLRGTLVFYAINFLIAGAMFALQYAAMSSGQLYNGVVRFSDGQDSFSVRPTYLSAAVLFAVSVLLYRSFLNSTRIRDRLTGYLAQVEIRIGAYSAQCTGLIDTGNQLYDPLTRTPVMVMDWSNWEPLLPEKWLSLIRASQVEQIIADLDDGSYPWRDRLRLVPFRGVNRNSNFMLAIKPDSVLITYNGKRMETKKVLLGIDGGNLSSDGTYQAIIHPGLIQAEAG